MWCEKLKNGNVRYLERYKDASGKVKRVSVTFPKETRQATKQAQNILSEKIAMLSDDSDLTLGVLADMYLRASEKGMKPTSFRTRKGSIQGLVSLIGANKKVSALNSGRINDIFIQQGLSNSLINTRTKTLKLLMRWGYERDLVGNIDWMVKLKPRKTDAKEKLEDKFLESEELKQIIDALPKKEWEFLAELTALSGMRIGEALALTNNDIDFRSRTISISKTYSEDLKLTQPPKTASSYREIYMQDELLDCCHRIKLYFQSQKFAIGYRTDLFMSDKEGKWLNYGTYNRALKRASSVLDRDITVTTHVMRHTHVALLAEAGVPLEVISRRLGHDGSDTTRKVYLHVTERAKEKERENMKEIRLLS